jgi:hypothetical protein
MPDPFVLPQIERYTAWLAALAAQGQAAAWAFFVGAAVWAIGLWLGELWPAQRERLTWIGVGGFYATLVALWAAGRAGLVG